MPCDDGDDCTTGEILGTDCNCGGGILIDTNNNGICDLDDTGCDVLNQEDFEADSGIWQSGGNDAQRVLSANSPGGNYSFRLRDNSGINSAVFSVAQDFSTVESMSIRFQFRTFNLSANESFSLLISNDGGNSFTTSMTWFVGSDFINNVLYSEAVYIPANSLSNNVVIRFECNASINSDEVFLDNISLESCPILCVDNVVDLNFTDLFEDTSAMISIQSNGTVISPNVVDFHAGDNIELLDGFEVEIGAVFHAYISPCTN